jgi:ring-1,2-phenylacetyl-CoA epoxidase subunit PaaD
MVNTAAVCAELPRGPLHLPEQPGPERDIWRLLETVCDPEIPVLSLREIGVLRAIKAGASSTWQIVITPTYSGCPAISQMKVDIQHCLDQACVQAQVITSLSPAWSSDWMTEQAKEKLRLYGIAPPHAAHTITKEKNITWLRAAKQQSIHCPRCHSVNTTLTSQFGSTACKALYTCQDCLEPFDYFKPY